MQIPPPSERRLLALANDPVPPSHVPIIKRVHDVIDEGINTALIVLPPSFLDALRQLAPKRRRLKLRYVIAAALVLVVGVLAADRSTRAYAVEEGRALAQRADRWRHPPAEAPTVTAAETTVAPPAAPVPPASPAATMTADVTAAPGARAEPATKADASTTRPPAKNRRGPRSALRRVPPPSST